MADFTFKRVLRFDPVQRKLRLFRVIRNVGVVGDGAGYSQKYAVSLCPKVFGFHRGCDEWRMTLLGLQLHSAKSFGGRFV